MMRALRSARLIACVMLGSLLYVGFAESNPLSEMVADRIAMETDALRLPCPDWWVDGIVELLGVDAHPECVLFEYHNVSLVRSLLDMLVRHQGLGQWATAWTRTQDDGANMRYVVIGGVGFHMVLWPEGDSHTLLNVTMPPEDLQEELRRSVGSR